MTDAAFEAAYNHAALLAANYGSKDPQYIAIFERLEAERSLRNGRLSALDRARAVLRSAA